MAATLRAAEARALRTPETAGTGWLGALELGFESRGARTVLARRRHRGPFMVQSAFHPEGAPCHVYLLHPPGGLVGGDRLRLDATFGAGSEALLTTPAAGKFYRSAGEPVRVEQRLALAPGAAVEFLPAESIVFDGARCESRTCIELGRGARLLAWDAWMLGRPVIGERFDTGSLAQSLEVVVEGRPVLSERTAVDGGGAWLDAGWGLGGRAGFCTLAAFPAGEDELAAARGATASASDHDAAASLVDGLLVCRAVAGGLVSLRAQMEAWWRALRPGVVGRTPVAPRIWAT